MNQILFDRTGAAAYLGVLPKFLGDAAKRNDGPPFVRYSQRTVIYEREDLDRYRDEHRVKPTRD